MLLKFGRTLEHTLTLVVAPMGYGKTTAVREWAEQPGMQAAWLSLDEGDNDPIFFWRYFCAACEAILPGVAERVGCISAIRYDAFGFIGLYIVLGKTPARVFFQL